MELGTEHSERELERALIAKIEDFLRAMGGLFAFMGSQYRLEVDGREFFLDLLLFHRRLRCLVAVELKVGDFQPEFVGKMQFYLTALDRQLRQENENPSIGIILCKEKSRTIVEYALHDQQSVEDGATVPLFYENRTPELHLVNPDLNDDIYRLIEEAALDAEQEEKLEKVLGRQYHLITRDDRLETVAANIVRNFLGRAPLDRVVGKAMVVSIDKATALKMYDKVKQHWAAETARISEELGKLALVPSGEMTAEQARRDWRKAELKQKLDVLTRTDMAVIVSPGQNEIEQMKKLGLNIEPHRRRMNESQPGLDEKFKDTEDPLRLVFGRRCPEVASFGS